ncbi:hypothetical protein PM082_019138 [Marasmius tenuissimus]|nr:hypothetical protein PM082_019138 [Marasmius tenuissimus]
MLKSSRVAAFNSHGVCSERELFYFMIGWLYISPGCSTVVLSITYRLGRMGIFCGPTTPVLSPKKGTKIFALTNSTSARS